MTKSILKSVSRTPFTPVAVAPATDLPVTATVDEDLDEATLEAMSIERGTCEYNAKCHALKIRRSDFLEVYRAAQEAQVACDNFFTTAPSKRVIFDKYQPASKKVTVFLGQLQNFLVTTPLDQLDASIAAEADDDKKLTAVILFILQAAKDYGIEFPRNSPRLEGFITPILSALFAKMPSEMRDDEGTVMCFEELMKREATQLLTASELVVDVAAAAAAAELTPLIGITATPLAQLASPGLVDSLQLYDRPVPPATLPSPLNLGRALRGVSSTAVEVPPHFRRPTTPPA